MDEIKPQPGPQEIALSSPADILILGGAAGGGKSWILEIEPLRHFRNPKFRCATFMRELTNITKPGSLWHKSQERYPSFGGVSRASPQLEWTFPAGSKITFSGMEHDKDRFKWKGAEIPLIQFDQLEAFLETQFWYLMSRLRSMSGVSGYVRASCNPDPDCFLASLLEWWIDQDTGYANWDKSGVLRWFVRRGDEIVWGDSKKELTEQMLDEGMDRKEFDPKSFTFVPSDIYHNKILLEKDPAYLPWLQSLTNIDRERLLKGNWKIRPSAGDIIDRTKIKMVLAAPRERDTVIVRAWDKAGRKGGSQDRTAGVKMSRTGDDYFIESVVAFREGAVKRESIISQTAVIDALPERERNLDCEILLQQNPADSGKTDVEDTVRRLAGFTVVTETLSGGGDKVQRVRPFATQVAGGSVYMVIGSWNEMALVELNNFDGVEGHLDDIPDATASAFNHLSNFEQLLISVGKSAMNTRKRVRP